MCGRWPATWAARSAVSAMSVRCGATAVGPFGENDMISLEQLDGFVP